MACFYNLWSAGVIPTPSHGILWVIVGMVAQFQTDKITILCRGSSTIHAHVRQTSLSLGFNVSVSVLPRLSGWLAWGSWCSGANCSSRPRILASDRSLAEFARPHVCEPRFRLFSFKGFFDAMVGFSSQTLTKVLVVDHGRRILCDVEA